MDSVSVRRDRAGELLMLQESELVCHVQGDSEGHPVPGACGSAATDEQKSALAVFASYCSLGGAAAVVTGGASSSKSSHTN
jgi:hypothetical protein